MSFLARTVTPLLIALAAATPPLKAESLDVRIGYLQWLPDQGGPVLSNVIPEPEDAGLRGGAELAINDNSTTGKFLGQTYSLQSDVADSEEAAIAAFDAMRENGLDLFVVNAPASTLKALTEKAGDNTLIFNAGAEDDALRTGQCHVNLLHTIPSYSMLTDALGQWLNQRRWDEVFLITGPPTEADRNWANAFRRSARRFGSRLSRTSPGPLTLISAARPPKSYPPCSLRPEITTRWWWPMCGGAILASTCRSTPGCHARWWAPRHVAGHLAPGGGELGGAAQLQNRFRELANRDMNSEDYAAWAAIRAIGTAVSDLNSANATEIRNFLFSDKFQLAAFKGRKVTFRDWNGQMRQPIPMVHPPRGWWPPPPRSKAFFTRIPNWIPSASTGPRANVGATAEPSVANFQNKKELHHENPVQAHSPCGDDRPVDTGSGQRGLCLQRERQHPVGD